MDVIFISGVTLGAYALRGLIESEAFEKGELRLNAIFSLSEELSQKTSGYQAFDDLAQYSNVPLHEITSIKTPAVIEQIGAYSPDLICIIGWSELASTALLDIPKRKWQSNNRHGPDYGCIGMHPTLLPQGRGRAPIPWAIIKGLTKSGVTLFYLEEQADAGDIIAQQEFEILLDDDAASIYEKAAQCHYELSKNTMTLLARHCADRLPQEKGNVTVWKKRTAKDGRIDWHKTQIEIYNWIRALTHPYTGAFTFWNGRKVFIWKSSLSQHPGQKGLSGIFLDICDAGITVACADGAITLQKMQIENEPLFDGATFASHYGLCIGMSFSAYFTTKEVI